MKQIFSRKLEAPPMCRSVVCIVHDSSRFYRLALQFEKGEYKVFDFKGQESSGGTTRVFDIARYSSGNVLSSCSIAVTTMDPYDSADDISDLHLSFVRERELPVLEAKREYWVIKGVEQQNYMPEGFTPIGRCSANTYWRKPTADGYPDIRDWQSQDPGMGLLVVDSEDPTLPGMIEWTPAGNYLEDEIRRSPVQKQGFPGFQYFLRTRGLHVDECVFDVWYGESQIAEEEEPPLDYLLRVTFEKVWR